MINMDSVTFTEKVRQSMMEQLATPSKLGLVSLDFACGHHDVVYQDFLDAIALISARIYDFAIAADITKDKDLSDAVKSFCILGEKVEKELFDLSNGRNVLKGTFFVMAIVTCAFFRLQGLSGQVDLSSLLNMVKDIAAFIPDPKNTHGAYVKETYGVDGALGSARSGYSYVAEVALPIYIGFLSKGMSKNEINQRVLLRLISAIDDSCVYHRASSLADDVKTIADYLCNNFNDENLSAALSYFDRCSISTGGSGDMLTLTIFLAKLFYA